MSAPTNSEVESLIMHRLNFEPSKGTTFEHFMNMLGFTKGGMRDGKPEFRILDQALQRLRKRGLIRFSKPTREWVKS